MSRLENILSICHPAVLFILIVLLILSKDFMNGKDIYFFAPYLAFCGAWAFYLNWLCNNNNGIIAWIMVFVPFISIMFLTRFIIVNREDNNGTPA
jgi:hypothetical protein